MKGATLISFQYNEYLQNNHHFVLKVLYLNLSAYKNKTITLVTTLFLVNREKNARIICAKFYGLHLILVAHTPIENILQNTRNVDSIRQKFSHVLFF